MDHVWISACCKDARHIIYSSLRRLKVFIGTEAVTSQKQIHACWGYSTVPQMIPIVDRKRSREK